MVKMKTTSAIRFYRQALGGFFNHMHPQNQSRCKDLLRRKRASLL